MHARNRPYVHEKPIAGPVKGDLKRRLLLAGGYTFVGLGLIGIVVPLLPTTPFLLLAAYCFARSSRRAHEWMLGNRLTGPYIRGFVDGSGISWLAKTLTIAFLWIGITASAVLAVDMLTIRIALFAIAVAVTVHLLMLRPRSRNQSTSRRDDCP